MKSAMVYGAAVQGWSCGGGARAEVRRRNGGGAGESPGAAR